MPAPPSRPGRAGASRLAVAALVVLTALGTVVQARMNGELVLVTRNPWQVGLLNLLVALLAASVVIAASPSMRGSWRALRAGLRGGVIRPWEVLGGLAGIFFVSTQSGAVPLIGVAVFTVCVVAGQTTSAVVVDRVGLGPAGRQPVTALRLLSVGMAIAAVALAVSDRRGGTEAGVAAAVVALLALAAGAASAVQSALNGRVVREVGQPLVAAWANFTVGAATGAVGLLLLVLLGGWPLAALPWDRPWLMLSGLLGLLYITTVAWAVRRLGVLLPALLSVVGLLVGALLVDLVAPTPGTALGWHIVAGVLLALAASALAAVGGRRGGSRDPGPDDRTGAR